MSNQGNSGPSIARCHLLENTCSAFRLAGRVLSRKFLLGGGGGGWSFKYIWEGAHSEREDFAKSAWREVIDPFHMKMHF